MTIYRVFWKTNLESRVPESGSEVVYASNPDDAANQVLRQVWKDLYISHYISQIEVTEVKPLPTQENIYRI